MHLLEAWLRAGTITLIGLALLYVALTLILLTIKDKL